MRKSYQKYITKILAKTYRKPMSGFSQTYAKTKAFMMTIYKRLFKY